MVGLLACCQGDLAATGACFEHLILEMPTRTGGAAEFLVGIDPRERDAESSHRVGDHLVNCVEGGLCRADQFIVAKDDDPEIPWIVVFDMGPLEFKRAGLPDSAFGIDGEVVADIRPAVVEMSLADQVHSANRIGI